MSKKGLKVEPVSPYWSNLSDFITHIEGLNKSLVSMALIVGILKSEEKKLESFINKKGKNIHRNKDSIQYTISHADSDSHDKLERERNNSRIAYKVLPRSIFVGLVSQFDIYVATLVKIILNTHSGIISPDKILTFRDIKNFKTIQEAVDHLIEKEIDALLFDSHSEHLKWIEAKTGIEIEKHFAKELPFFIELTERRNLYVHSDGVVNQHYLYKCKEAGVNIDPSLKKGMSLEITPEYFKQSVHCLYIIAFKLTYLLWKKFVPKDKEKADSLFINDIAVDLILQKKYKLAEELLSFANDFFLDSSDVTRRLFIINFALVKKLDGRKDEALLVIQKVDWTSCNNDFKLAVAVLKDDFDEAYKLMIKIGKEGELIDDDIYKTMPLFFLIRKQKKFEEVYKKIYKKKFSISNEKFETKISLGL